jgi:hypothetical protein
MKLSIKQGGSGIAFITIYSGKSDFWSEQKGAARKIWQVERMNFRWQSARITRQLNDSEAVEESTGKRRQSTRHVPWQDQRPLKSYRNIERNEDQTKEQLAYNAERFISAIRGSAPAAMCGKDQKVPTNPDHIP